MGVWEWESGVGVGTGTVANSESTRVVCSNQENRGFSGFLPTSTQEKIR
jgi:hypothetical protein